MPGSDSAAAVENLDPNEIEGMRTAGWILISTASVNLFGLFVGGAGLSPIGSIVDVILGAQLLRRRHSWRVWTMIRAAVGLAIGVAGLVAVPFGRGGLGVATLAAGQIAYSSSLLLLVFGIPTGTRVLAGQIIFAAAVVLLIAGAIVIAIQQVA